MSYWCQKYWEYDKKCDLRTRMQESHGEVVEAVFKRVPRDLTYADRVAAVDCLKEICTKCKGQR